MERRPQLSRERIVAAAAAVADRSGLGAVSMRTVARELGVEAMSLYHHISGKEALLDDLTDWVFTGIELPTEGAAWRAGMAARAASLRTRLAAHPWALGLIDSRRTPGPAQLQHHNAVLGCLRGDGFSVALAAHAFSVIDAYVYGFVLTETTVPMDPGESAEAYVEASEIPLESYPHMAEMVAELVKGRDYAYADEFDYGLDLILSSLGGRLIEERAAGED